MKNSICFFKKYKFLFILIASLWINNITYAQYPGSPGINAGPDQTIPCNSSTNLTATTLATGTTTAYTVSSIPYAPPFPYNAGAPIMIGIDDQWSSVQNLPFNFCFFGTSYNQLVIGSNGVISFNTSNAASYCGWSFSTSCPNPNIVGSNPGPFIFGPFHDVDPSVSGSQYVSVFGTAPCRTFLISWYQVSMFSASCNYMYATHQIVLYETTNIIEVYIQNAPLCSSWNSGNKLIGIQNAGGTIGYTPPGRNTGAWSAINEAWRFTPDGSPNNSIISWWQNGVQIGTGATINVTPPTATPTIYTAHIQYNTNCDGTQFSDSDDVIVNVVNQPVITSVHQSICTGFSDSLTVYSGPGFSYIWSNGLGTSPTVIVAPTTTTTYTVTATDGTCTGTGSYTLIVDSLPVVSAISDFIAICSGDTISLHGEGALTYEWNHGVLNSVPFAPQGTLTYIVTGTDENGCVNIDSTIVSVNPLPVVSFSGIDTNYCYYNSAITLNGNPSGGIFTGDGINGNNFTPLQAGNGNHTITYSYTDGNGCSNFSDFVTNVLDTPSSPNICMVTVDSTSTNNIIYWDKTIYTNVDSFIVYRETSSNLYKRIGAVSFESLSLFVDTVRTLYFPFTGNPNVGTYRYKLQLLDSCGNYDPLSNFHNTLFVTKSGGNFNWNDYKIEGETTPIPQLTAYYLLRDNNGTGNWTVISGVSGSQLTINDPDFASYPHARWRIETQWSTVCSATKSLNKARSNIVGYTVGISAVDLLSPSISIYPNPFSTKATIEINNFDYHTYELQIVDMLGRKVYSSELTEPVTEIKTGKIQSGVYFVHILFENKIIANKKVVIQ